MIRHVSKASAKLKNSPITGTIKLAWIFGGKCTLSLVGPCDVSLQLAGC